MERSGGREIHDEYRIICQVHTTSTGGYYGGTSTTSAAVIAKPPRIPRTYCCCIIIFSSPVQPHVRGPISSLLPCMRVLPCVYHETHEPACNVESKPLNCWNSVLTAPLIELTVDVFEIFLRKTSTAESQPEHDASTSETSSDTSGVGEQDEGVSGRGNPHRKLARQKLKNTSKKS